MLTLLISEKHPLISSLGATFFTILVYQDHLVVKMQERSRRDSGMSKLTNSLVNKSQRISSIVNIGSFMI